MRWFRQILRWWRRLCQPLPLGKAGEREATRYLKRQGFLIVAQGDRGRLGEIDIVAIERRTVVFVEVKTRSSHDAGHPTQSIDRIKQRRLTRAARGYLKRHDLEENPARFDVIAITWPDVRKRPVIEHFRNAFEATD